MPTEKEALFMVSNTVKMAGLRGSAHIRGINESKCVETESASPVVPSESISNL